MTDLATPTQVIDAEQVLLGAAMGGYPNLDDLLDVVQASDFYSPFHEEVWAAIGRVHHAGNRPDPISVRLALSQAAVRHDPVKLIDMVQAVPVVAQAPYYAQQVVEASGLRALQQAGVRIQQLGATLTGDLEELQERARQEVDAATQGRVTTSAKSVGEILPAVLDIAQHGAAKVLPTGWDDLDRLIGGLAPGRVVVVGARPGVGKSLMGVNLALHFALKHQHAVLFASMEMSNEEVTQRMLANHARTNLTALMEGKTADADWERIARKHDEIANMPCKIIDAPNQTVTSIRREARNYQRVRDDLSLIIVDYLQMLTVPGGSKRGREASRVQDVGDMSRGLKLLARETGACVVAMAQVNRNPAGRNERPRQSDLRESGSIEADADQVILLHQPDDEVPELEVIVDKNRHGIKGVATLEVHGHYARLASVQWSPSTKAIGR